LKLSLESQKILKSEKSKKIQQILKIYLSDLVKVCIHKSFLFILCLFVYVCVCARACACACACAYICIIYIYSNIYNTVK